ncbi:MAG: hypothetical protein P0116_06675 [Candidatus Nitrosocosmicus sp.]|nr:hypothetical protein [Candidatus Nitrosocosmicus sp.]
MKKTMTLALMVLEEDIRVIFLIAEVLLLSNITEIEKKQISGMYQSGN